jgi:DHA2 family multidrug resistance protein
MAIWAMGVTVGPILGPTLGGWLTEIATWRWTFYINLPVGVLSLFLSSQFVRETPKSPRRMDWTGFGLLVLGVASVQYLLDRGNHQDWFAATDIRIAAVFSVIGLVAFLYYSITKGRASVFDVHILRDRNFGMSCLITLLMGVGMFGGMVLQPILLESLLGYPIVTTGMIMAPRGIASAITMMFVGRLVSVIETRVLVLVGVALCAGGSYMMTFYSTDISTHWVVWPGVLQGIGTGFIFVPLSTIAYATLDRTRIAEAAGIFSLVRTIGAAIGISIITTVTTHQTQVIWNELGGHITAYSAPLASYLNHLHLPATDPRGLAIVARQVGVQAQMGAMLDAFKMIAWSYVFMLPLLFFFKKPEARIGAPLPAAAVD